MCRRDHAKNTSIQTQPVLKHPTNAVTSTDEQWARGTSYRPCCVAAMAAKQSRMNRIRNCSLRHARRAPGTKSELYSSTGIKKCTAPQKRIRARAGSKAITAGLRCIACGAERPQYVLRAAIRITNATQPNHNRTRMAGLPFSSSPRKTHAHSQEHWPCVVPRPAPLCPEGALSTCRPPGGLPGTSLSYPSPSLCRASKERLFAILTRRSTPPPDDMSAASQPVARPAQPLESDTPH